MSWVFLAGDRVYKLKKPVSYPFLDFSTLDAREADCRAEDRLNRRLAPDIYLGVEPVTVTSGGALSIGGIGEIADWLVVMRRLPDERFLDAAIRKGSVTRAQIRQAADLLAGFYRACEPVEVSPDAYVAQFAREHHVSRTILASRRFNVDGERLQAVLAAIDREIAGDAPLLRERAADRRIIEGHGDLRPEHVCLTDPPVVIDCLEFNRALRLVDPLDELAFLAMECDRLGAPQVGAALMQRCAQRLGEKPAPRLLAFYTAYRAVLRARLSAAHLLDHNARTPEKWLPQARAYLEIAARACITLHPPEGR